MGRGAGRGGDASQWAQKQPGHFDFTGQRGDVVVTFSMEEVQKHRTPTDAWMVYKNKVYDVSGWHEHPGGNVIFTHAGDDFTDIFAAFHPPTAYAVLEPFYIGDLDDKSAAIKPAAQLAFERAYRDLRSKLLTMGMFNADPWYYTMVCARQMALWAASVACVLCSDSWAVNMFGALLMAVFWQQCGWLAHDFLHHQVFKYRPYGDLAGVFWGDLMQGFSVGWWKNKHNTHHAVPNLHESSADAHDGDPDIDTMPLLAWSLRMAECAKDSPFARFMIRYQALLYFPILFIARVSWAMQSFLFVFDSLPGNGVWSTKNVATARLNSTSLSSKLEMPALIGHYAWMGYLALHLGFLKSVAFFTIAQCLCGLFLALVFGLGHNGMATYDADARPDFWKLQVTTTRNVTSTPFVDWFCGGLQYQVDHHLFPQIPRHNLGKVHTLVESFCKKHGVRYHEASMYDGTVEVLEHLGVVSREFIAHFPAM
ncbi:unnamed protein product [Ascophyllum nodosum]